MEQKHFDENEHKNILKTEYSYRFDDIRKAMMVASYYKYGSLKDNYNNLTLIKSKKYNDKYVNIYHKVID